MKPLNQIVLDFVITSCLAAAAYGDGFTSTGSMGLPRYNHTATLLADGKVLVTGGTYGFDSDLDTAELYNPATGTWSPTGSLGTERESHTATLLPNGKVLVAGGVIRGGYTIPLASAELYNPANGTWTNTGNIGPTRYSHTATLLPNGKVLVVGGDGGFGALSTAELYNPATGTWSSTGSLANSREGHTATLLLSGSVLVAGGGTNTAELYNPATGAWTPTGRLGTARYDHTATLLPNGKVLVAGGDIFVNGSGTVAFDSAELYDPATGTWSSTGNLGNARYNHTAALLPNGKVVVAGGRYVSSAEVYDPTTGIWSPTGGLDSERFGHTATLLANGKILVAGGVGSFAYLSSAEVYQSSLNPIINPIRLGDGSFQFSFFGNPGGTNYSVLTSPNLAAPLNTWSNLGSATETAPGSGQYQFTDHQAINYPQRFYRVSAR